MHTKSQLQPSIHYSSRHTVKTAHRMMATPLSLMMRSLRSSVHSEQRSVCTLTTASRLSLEVLLLVYIQSLCERNFELYVQSLTQIMPWMFNLDHTHYSRWLSVHNFDMLNLIDKHPDVLAEFRSETFVVHKTSNKFFAMSIDQCHEQNNAVVKGSG